MLKNTLNAACRLFTAMVVVYSLLILLIYSADPESSLALSAARIFLFFPFALAVCAATRIFDVKAMDTWLKTSLHFIVTMLATFLCLILPIGGDLTSTAMLVGMFLFCVIYAAVFAVLALCRARDTRKNNREQEYTPVYRKPIDKKE
jgi:hypothetical protein